MKKIILLVAASLLAFVHHAYAQQNQELEKPPAGQARIVFLRSTWVNALVKTEIHDVTTGDPKLVGPIYNRSKIVMDTSPGEHIFMVGNVSYRDFLKASLLADKTYYVVVTAYWPARFSLRAFRHQNSEFLYSSSDFADLRDKTELLQNAPDASKIDPENLEKTRHFYRESWEKWLAKTPEQKAILTLNQDDFVE